MEATREAALEAFCNRYLSIVTEITLKDLGLHHLKRDNPTLYIQLALQLETFRRHHWDKPQSKHLASLSQRQLLVFTGLTSLTVFIIVGLVSLVLTWYVGFQAGLKQAPPPPTSCSVR